MKLALYAYRVRVYDPKQNNEVVYDFRAFTDLQAIQQAKDGYTGLLVSDLERAQAHLEVEITQKVRA